MTLDTWTFTPFPPLPPTILPSVAFWNVSNEAKNLTYQIEISWPYEWESRNVTTNKTAIAMYVLDGNAYASTAHTGFHRRKFLLPTQQDAVVIGVGYPLSNHIYDLVGRTRDFAPPPVPGPDAPRVPADDFIVFLDEVLRPWVRAEVFPGTNFVRDALFGHSFGGLFGTYALIKRPDLFDTFLLASPGLNLNNGSLLGEVTRVLGNGSTAAAQIPGVGVGVSGNGGECTGGGEKKGPAVMITYGELERWPKRRREWTEEEFNARRALLASFNMAENCHDLFDRLVGSGRMREVVLREYAGLDHSAVAAATVTEGITFFTDWKDL